MLQNITVFVVAVLAFISFSSGQDTFNADLERAMAPYMHAALSVRPLFDLLMRDFQWARNNLLGYDLKPLRSTYRSFSQKIIASGNEARTQASKNCYDEAKTLLDSTTGMFRTDGSCLKQKEEEVFEIGFALYKSIFPVPPTASCPIPILCKLNIRNLGLMEIKPAMDLLKGVLVHAKKLLEFTLYFPRDLRKCRMDQTKYIKIASSILNLSTLCRRL